MFCISPGTWCHSLIHQHFNPIVEGQQICQERFDLSEVVLPLTHHLLIFHAPSRSFQEDLHHDHGKASRWDWPYVFLFSIFENEGFVFPFQFGRNFTGLLQFWNTMASGLAISSANSLRTCGCTAWGPVDLCIFGFLRWSWTWSSSVGSSSFSQSPPSPSGTQVEKLPLKTGGRTSLGTSAFSMFGVTRSHTFF